MKKLLNIVLALAALAMYFFFPDQNTYYLNDQIFEPSDVQVILISSGIMLVLLIYFLRFNEDYKQSEDKVWDSIKASAFLVLIGWILLFPAIRNGVLLVNRVYSSEQKVVSYQVRVIGSYRFPDIKNEQNEDIIFNLNDKFKSLKNTVILDKDSLSVQLEKGIFGYYYINHDKTRVIPIKNQ